MLFSNNMKKRREFLVEYRKVRPLVEKIFFSLKAYYIFERIFSFA